MYYKREGFHSDNEKPRWGQAPYSGVYREDVLFYLGLFSFIIFLKHVNLTLVCYSRSIEVRKIGKLLLERHKGGRDRRLIEVAGRVFSLQRFPPKFIGIVF